MQRVPGACRAHAIAFFCAALAATSAARADDASSDELTELREQIQILQRRDADRQRQMEDMQSEVRELRDTSGGSQGGAYRSDGDLWSARVGPGAEVRLMDVGLSLLGAAGWSSERDESLEVLQGGGHDPRQRGFTLQQIELSMLGAVDPYFTGEVHLIYFLDQEGESRFELEEAFATSTSLPWNLEVEAGHFFTEFGRINPRHPHTWTWQDAPVIHSRLFGEDGLRAPGVRVGWLAPLPWFSEVHFGVQNARGETMVSFLSSDEAVEERGGIGGRPFVERDTKAANELIYLLRWVNGFDVSDTISAQLGGSFLRGPNASGPDGRTHVFGADFVAKWRPLASDRGWPFVLFEAEAMHRTFHADGFQGVLEEEGEEPEDGESLLIPRQTLRDWGFYAQLLYGFTRGWAVGLRGEYATGKGRGFDLETGGFVSRDVDPFRNDRFRVSPMVLWQPTEFSRLRLQYNYDWADHLKAHAHSVWVGLDISLGAHPAHTY